MHFTSTLDSAKDKDIKCLHFSYRFKKLTFFNDTLLKIFNYCQLLPIILFLNHDS